MAKKAKGNRVQVILECTEHKASGMPGMSRYITTKNRKNTTGRLELKKYNPILKRMTIFPLRLLFYYIVAFYYLRAACTASLGTISSLKI